MCAPASVQLDTVVGYPVCAPKNELEASRMFSGGTEMLSADDFYIDIDLLMGTPAPIADLDGLGAWQAWQVPAFATIAETSPNCTGTYQDSGLSALLAAGVSSWAWGFWSANRPYVSHNEAGYDPMSFGPQSKWFAEFGVSRTGGTLPAFAVGVMPKMTTLLSPRGFPQYVMGEHVDVNSLVADLLLLDVAEAPGGYQFLMGQGAPYFFRYYAQGFWAMYTALGVLLIILSFVLILPCILYKQKQSSS